MFRYGVTDRYQLMATPEYVERFVDIPRFLKLCRSCPSHNQTWACPEFDFDPLEVWAGRPWLHVFVRAMAFTPEQPRTGFSRSELTDRVHALFQHEKRQAHVVLMDLLAANPGSIALGAGGCDLCPTCSRMVDEPCRRPDQLTYSIESLGGNVEATLCELFGITAQWSDGTTLPDVYHLVIGLLAEERVLKHPSLATRLSTELTG